MADERAVVPYHDPYDIPYTDEDLRNFISNTNPSLGDLTLNDASTEQINNPSVINISPEINNFSVIDNTLAISNPLVIGNPSVVDYPSSSSFPPPNDRVSDADDPFDDPVLTWVFGEETDKNNLENFNEGLHGNDFEATSSGGNSFEGNNWRMQNNLEGCDHGGVSSRPLSGWVHEPNPSLCNFCQVLRELIHTNGQDITRLEIHGRIGIIWHAVLEIQPNAATTEEYRYQMLDFSQKSIEDVKQFLQQYCLERFEAGFVMVQDPLASFYKAICIGLDWEENVENNDELINSLPLAAPNPVSAEAEPPPEAPKEPEPEKKKSALAAQRERTGKMTLKDLGKYFHLPIEEAARRMKLCPTVVKKICRRGGLARWPHRKIKSIERKISLWKASLRSSKPAEKARAEAEIQKLQQEIEKIRSGPERD